MLIRLTAALALQVEFMKLQVPRKLNKIVVVELALLALLIVYDLEIISMYGSTWDNSASYFNTLTMLGRSSYYEMLREPLVQFFMLPFAFLTQNFYVTVEAVSVLLTVLFFFAVKKLAHALKVKGASLYLVAVTGIVIGFMTLLNLADILGATLVILALAYYYEGKNIESSIMFGLSFLAKFTNLIFIFYLPFIFRKKELARSLAIVFLVNLPWFAVNYALFGNPFYGYMQANQIFSSLHTVNLTQLGAALLSLFVLNYQFIIVFCVIAVALHSISQVLKKYAARLDVRDYSLMAVAFVEFLYVGSAQNFVAWLGYPVFIAFLVPTAKLLSAYQNDRKTAGYVNAAAAFAAFSLVIASMMFAGLPYGPGMVKPAGFSKMPAYPQSILAAHTLNCTNIYSNAWPYLMIYNQSVKSVFGGQIPDGACVIMFNESIGTVFNTGNMSLLHANGNFSIFMK